MKSLIVAICILAIIGAIVAIAAKAVTEEITCTVLPVEIALTVSPATTDYGSMDVSEVKKADTTNTDDEFIITNTGNVAETFTVIGADATGGTGWTLSTTSVGSSIFMHAYSALKTLTATTTLGSDESTEWVALDKDSIYNTLSTDVASSMTADLVLELLTPSSVSDYVQKSTTVTVQAEIYE